MWKGSLSDNWVDSNLWLLPSEGGALHEGIAAAFATIAPRTCQSAAGPISDKAGVWSAREGCIGSKAIGKSAKSGAADLSVRLASSPAGSRLRNSPSIRQSSALEGADDAGLFFDVARVMFPHSFRRIAEGSSHIARRCSRSA